MDHNNSHDHHDDNTTLPIIGVTLPLPVYTVVFIALGILTVIEVLASGISAEAIKVPVLIGIALVKAYLVVTFYMHLRTDSRIFALTLLLPVLIALLSALYLLGVPSTGY